MEKKDFTEEEIELITKAMNDDIDRVMNMTELLIPITVGNSSLMRSYSRLLCLREYANYLLNKVSFFEKLPDSVKQSMEETIKENIKGLEVMQIELDLK